MILKNGNNLNGGPRTFEINSILSDVAGRINFVNPRDASSCPTIREVQ